MAKKKPKKRKVKKLKKSKSSRTRKSKKRKARKKKATRIVFEGRTNVFEPTEPPASFDINLGNITQEEAFAVIKARLEDARSRLPERYDSRIIIHPYVDGSVDGELYVKVPEGTGSADTSWDLYEAFQPLAVGTRYWMSVGARYIIEEDDEVYRRNRGMNLVETNYQRATAPNVSEEHDLLERKLLPGMQNRYKREASNIFIRLHWNPEGERPKR